jgi:hypothetical protein
MTYPITLIRPLNVTVGAQRQSTQGSGRSKSTEDRNESSTAWRDLVCRLLYVQAHCQRPEGPLLLFGCARLAATAAAAAAAAARCAADGAEAAEDLGLE